MYKLYVLHQKKCGCYLASRAILPVGILVHSTGANNPNLKRYVEAEKELGKNPNGNHWNRPELTVQVHAFIGRDINGEIAVAETLPQNIACWGCGKGKNGSYNYNPTAHIQFEICEQQGDLAYFNSVFAAAIEYCADLCKRYGWNETNITSHVEAARSGYASNHGDPEHWMKQYGKDMNWFRDEVRRILTKSENKPDHAAPPDVPQTEQEQASVPEASPDLSTEPLSTEKPTPPKDAQKPYEPLSDSDDDFTVPVSPFKTVPKAPKPFGSIMGLIGNIIKRIAKLKK